ncbi:hypothetical protein [Halorussus caseinilyticus]|uniref:hypothetical protein n=1 Tax=Halorussus caseinilyticus TaxID=3034025 RepID=UPI0023E77079|nr:hypothetical protein [Halorussus sp. DT72]
MSSRRARLVGGLQWAITGAYVFLFGFLAVAWYLRATRTAVALDLSPAFVAVVVASFLAGYLWVGSCAPAAGAHDRRVEVVLTMLVLGFLLPFGVPPLFDRLGVGRTLPLFGVGVAYALTLALSYGLVYGLGFRFFLGPERPDARE